MAEQSENPEMTVREAGRRGGLKTAAMHGRAHYQAAGKLGGARTRDKYEALDSEHYQKLGEQGGNALKEKYGPAYFFELAAKGVAGRKLKDSLRKKGLQ